MTSFYPGRHMWQTNFMMPFFIGPLGLIVFRYLFIYIYSQMPYYTVTIIMRFNFVCSANYIVAYMAIVLNKTNI